MKEDIEPTIRTDRRVTDQAPLIAIISAGRELSVSPEDLPTLFKVEGDVNATTTLYNMLEGEFLVLVEPAVRNGSRFAHVQVTIPAGSLTDVFNNTNPANITLDMTYEAQDPGVQAAAGAVQGAVAATIAVGISTSIAVASSAPVPILDTLAFAQSMSLMNGLQANLGSDFRAMASSTNFLSFNIPLPFQKKSVPDLGEVMRNGTDRASGSGSGRRRALLASDSQSHSPRHEYITVTGSRHAYATVHTFHGQAPPVARRALQQQQNSSSSVEPEPVEGGPVPVVIIVTAGKEVQELSDRVNNLKAGALER